MTEETKIPFHIRQAWWEYVEQYNYLRGKEDWNEKGSNVSHISWRNFRAKLRGYYGPDTITDTEEGARMLVFPAGKETVITLSYKDPL